MALNAGNNQASGPGRLRAISFRDVSLLARVATLCGFDIESVLAEVGISAADIQDEGVYADLGVISALMDLGIRRSSRAYYPFVLGEHYGFEHTPEVQTFLATSSSLREALWMLDFLPYFVHPCMTSRYQIDGDHFTIYFELRDDSGTASSPGLIEATHVVLNQVLTRLLGRRIRVEIQFRHQPMTALAEYERQFGSRPSFGASHDAARYEVALLDHPLPSGSPALHAKMQLFLELRLQQLQSVNGLDNMLSILLKHTPDLTIEAAAKRLGIGPRSLQRKLKETGATFAVIQSQARFQLAKSMLADHELDMDAIAAKLGFADRTTFSKAFSKWAGLPPATYRRVRSK